MAAKRREPAAKPNIERPVTKPPQAHDGGSQERPIGVSPSNTVDLRHDSVEVDLDAPFERLEVDDQHSGSAQADGLDDDYLAGVSRIEEILIDLEANETVESPSPKEKSQGPDFLTVPMSAPRLRCIEPPG